MWFTISIILIVAVAIYLKITLNKSRKALEDPDTFLDYCLKNGYDTKEKQLEFCERMKVDISVVEAIHELPAKEATFTQTQKAFEVCFTGFSSEERAHLEGFANSKGLIVRKDVTKNLNVLCCGANAGPVKQRKASEKGCLILNRQEFEIMLETGEVPENVYA